MCLSSLERKMTVKREDTKYERSEHTMQQKKYGRIFGEQLFPRSMEEKFESGEENKREARLAEVEKRELRQREAHCRKSDLVGRESVWGVERGLVGNHCWMKGGHGENIH